MKNLPFSLLSSNELYTTSSRIVDASKVPLSTNPYVSSLCTHLEQFNSSLARGLGRALTSEFTSALLVCDQARDHAFIGFRDFVHAFCHVSDPEIAAAATSLALIIENVGNTVYSRGYAVETARLNTLILNLSTPAAQQAINKVSASGWLEMLQSTQLEFEDIYKSKIETESAIDYPLVKDSKEKITKYLKALLSYIDANSELDAAKFEAIKESINEIITDSVAIARARSTRKENDEKEPEQTAV